MSVPRFSRAFRLAPLAFSAAVLAVLLTLAVRPVASHPRITTTLLWTKDIAPILQRRCFSCHSPNNVAMSLITYAEARPWAAAIREEVLTRHMPPWSATPGYGRFANDPSLTQGEWDLLVAWVDGGAPSGQTLEEAEQPPVFVPSAPVWQHGEPDVVVRTSEHHVASGTVDQIQRFDVASGLTGDQRVHGIAFKPGDRRVVRYATIMDAGTKRWLFTWTPWHTAMHLPEGVAFPLKAGAKLTVEIGYHGTDEATADTSEVGLYLEKTAGTGVASVLQVQAAPVDVAPGGRPVRVRAEAVLDETAALSAVWPEPGPGATSMELTAFLPDGSVRPLVWLRDYRSDWPSPLVFADPVPLPRGARLVLTTYLVNTTDAPVKAQPRVQLTRVPTAVNTF